jgi:hypothetical protein
VSKFDQAAYLLDRCLRLASPHLEREYEIVQQLAKQEPTENAAEPIVDHKLAAARLTGYYGATFDMLNNQSEWFELLSGEEPKGLRDVLVHHSGLTKFECQKENADAPSRYVEAFIGTMERKKTIWSKRCGRWLLDGSNFSSGLSCTRRI